jgi:hypothetical protein
MAQPWGIEQTLGVSGLRLVKIARTSPECLPAAHV